MRRHLTSILTVTFLIGGCGGAATIEGSSEGFSGDLALAELPAQTPATEPAPTRPPLPSPTPTQSSRVAPLEPAAWGPRPLLMRNAPVPAFDAAAAIVMDQASGDVMFEYNAEKPLAIASLTKIASAVVALKAGDLDRWVTVDVDASSMPGSSVMGLHPGDEFKLRDLLYGMMLPSGNDAALAVARAVAGSDQAFVQRMNALVAGLGLVETRFTNPHGLGSQQASAYDLAALTRYAFSVPGFQELASARWWTASGSRTIGMWNSNALVGSYEGADGVKIGYTNRAGNTMVGSATRNGHRLIVVLLNASNNQADARELLDWAFANHAWPVE